MERRLRSFFARQGAQVLTDSLDRLRKDRRQLETLLDRVTINVSQLWRHPDQWARLRQSVLPELAAKGTLRAWSAGCSYGAEAYTLAAVCADTIPDVALDDHRHRHRPADGRDGARRAVHRSRRA